LNNFELKGYLALFKTPPIRFGVSKESKFHIQRGLKVRVQKDRDYKEVWAKEIYGKRKCVDRETWVK
jgi:hypothetical protein